MSSIRRSTLQKSFKKSLANLEKHESSDSDLDGTRKRSKQARSHSKLVVYNKTEEKQKNISGIQEMSKQDKNMIEDIELKIEEEDLNDKDLNDKDLDEKIDRTNRQEQLSKLSHQSLVDTIVECEFKYKRLAAMVDQMKATFVELTNSHLKEKQDLVEVKKKLLENIFQVETEKFAIDDKNRELIKENEKLRKQIEEYETKDIEKCSETIREKQNISLINKATTPQALSRASRRKILYEKLFLEPRKSSKELIYENAIVELQDIVDFYSLLTGISVWKELNIGEEDTSDEDVPNSLFFNCKLQLFSSSLDEFEFGMVLDFVDNSISFKPKTVEEKQSYYEFLPQVLKSETKFNLDDGYLFLKKFFAELPKIE